MIDHSRYQVLFVHRPKMFDGRACANCSCSTKFKNSANMCTTVIPLVCNEGKLCMSILNIYFSFSADIFIIFLFLEVGILLIYFTGLSFIIQTLLQLRKGKNSMEFVNTPCSSY